jgi:GrpB-like predicted nucleotidyltransferase (UPF0157 family)
MSGPVCWETVCVSGRPRIVEYDPTWPDQFAVVAARVRTTLTDVAMAVEHIGSTAVPGLAAKDIIDVMAVVVTDSDLGIAAETLAGAGWSVRPPGMNDHPVPGLPGDPQQWVKRFAGQPAGMRPVNLHLRIAGRANARYAALFRDFLAAHPLTTASYAEAKRRLAALCDTTAQYADAKDPICDLVYLPAEEWAESTGWQEPWNADRRWSSQRP